MSNLGSEEAKKAIEKAIDAIECARHDLSGGFILASANRAYYAAYYCMTALLYKKKVYAKTHQGTRLKFSEIYIKTGVFHLETAETIALLFDNRQEADYDLDADITKEEAENLVMLSANFLELTQRHLASM